MITIPNYPIGETVTVQRVVSEADTATNYGSGQLENIFAIPSLVTLMLEAGSNLVDAKLPDGFISVGKTAMVDHTKPTILGETVTVEVSVTKVDGNKIHLQMVAYDEIGQIGRGENLRVIVNKASLLRKANERSEELESKDF